MNEGSTRHHRHPPPSSHTTTYTHLSPLHSFDVFALSLGVPPYLQKYSLVFWSMYSIIYHDDLVQGSIVQSSRLSSPKKEKDETNDTKEDDEDGTKILLS
jgi:hypothetical protein